MELGRNVWALMYAEAHLSLKGLERCGGRVTCISLYFIILCYVIGRSIRLVYKPFVLSPHLSPTTPLAHTPLNFFEQKCLWHLPLSRQSRLQFLCKPRPSISAALQANPEVSLRLSLNPRYPEPLLLPLTMCERYLWRTWPIFINGFWFFKGPYEYIQVPLYFVIVSILKNDFYRPVP